MGSSSYLCIDLSAIEHNVRFFTQKGPVMAMVKANAYGVGAIELIPHLKRFGVDFLGVSHVSEGIYLREAGIDLPIFVISALPMEAEAVIKYRLQPSVNSEEEIEALSKAALSPLPVHLHVDTGMNRFGFKPDEVSKIVKKIKSLKNLHLEGIFTHFSSSELPEQDFFTKHQISIFKDIVEKLDPKPRWVHAANSSGADRFSLPFCNLSRIGIALFGYANNASLLPALTFTTYISFISFPKKGEGVGYHSSYKVQKDPMKLGVIPVGYYDGIHRAYKEKGYVLIHGKPAPMVGNICMDFMMIDLTEIPEAQVGDTVTLFDSRLNPETVAGWVQTDVRELLVSIGPRTCRIIKEHSREKHEQRLSNTFRSLQENPTAGKHLLST